MGLGVSNEEGNPSPRTAEDMSAERTEFATSDDEGFSPLHRRLIQDFMGGSEWFGEDGPIERNLGGHDVEIGDGKSEKFGESTVPPKNSQYRSLWTVSIEARLTGRTLFASRVDFPDHALAENLWMIIGPFDTPDELVAEDSGKVHVARNQLKIGVADTCVEHPNESFARRNVGKGTIFDPQFTCGGPDDGEHGTAPVSRPAGAPSREIDRFWEPCRDRE